MQQCLPSILVRNVFSKVEARTFLRSSWRLRSIISHPIYRCIPVEISSRRGQISRVFTPNGARDRELFSNGTRKASTKLVETLRIFFHFKVYADQ